MNNTLISIIVPIYNVEQYLNKCVDSIIHQSYSKLEIILVDDGSPDKCGEICNEYAAKDNRVKVVHKKNGGLSDARNAGIELAKGEWITFVDSDDYISVDYVETLYGLVAKNECKVGVACVQYVYDGNVPPIHQRAYQEYIFDKWKGIEEMFYQELFDTMAWCKIYHKSLFETGIRYPYGIYYEDLPTTYLLFLHTDSIAFCNKKIYYYLQRKNSIERQTFNALKLESALEVLKKINKDSDKLKPVYRALRCRLLSFCFHILLEMPSNYPDERKEILLEYVKQNRLKVLFDIKARKKARIGALLSYLGIDITRKVLNSIKHKV